MRSSEDSRLSPTKNTTTTDSIQQCTKQHTRPAPTDKYDFSRTLRCTDSRDTFNMDSSDDEDGVDVESMLNAMDADDDDGEKSSAVGMSNDELIADTELDL